MDTQQWIFIITGSSFVLIGIILLITWIILNKKNKGSKNISLKQSSIHGLAGVWGFFKRHIWMFSIIVCFVFGFASFMGLIF